MLSKSSLPPLTGLTHPEDLSHLLVRNHSALPLPINSISNAALTPSEGQALIRAIGIGPRGAELVQILSRNLPGILCHEVIFDPRIESAEPMIDLLTTVQKSDLLFVLTGFEDEDCDRVARTIIHAGREGGALTLAIIPEGLALLPQNLQKLSECADAVFVVSDGSLVNVYEPPLVQKGALIGYAMRHLVTAISTMILQRSMICVDFADIVTMMGGGKSGRLGVGVAAGPEGGGTATLRAIERLTAQGVSILDATDVLAIIQGSSLFTMDDFDDVSKGIHDQAVKDANIVVGFIMDDPLGYNIRVSILALQ